MVFLLHKFHLAQSHSRFLLVRQPLLERSVCCVLHRQNCISIGECISIELTLRQAASFWQTALLALLYPQPRILDHISPL